MPYLGPLTKPTLQLHIWQKHIFPYKEYSYLQVCKTDLIPAKDLTEDAASSRAARLLSEASSAVVVLELVAGGVSDPLWSQLSAQSKQEAHIHIQTQATKEYIAFFFLGGGYLVT